MTDKRKEKQPAIIVEITKIQGFPRKVKVKKERKKQSPYGDFCTLSQDNSADLEAYQKIDDMQKLLDKIKRGDLDD